jgi:hypothetical protein
LRAQTIQIRPAIKTWIVGHPFEATNIDARAKGKANIVWLNRTRSAHKCKRLITLTPGFKKRMINFKLI